MLISLTVGKVDAGVAVLLTQDKRLIEFPSILLPPHISSGSIVDITVSRNFDSESQSQESFNHLQDSIFHSFGETEPSSPVLRCRNATQTSIVLEWDPIELATADVISLSLFRNGQKAGNIPQPTTMESTKISGLAVDTEYTFHLVLRTTAGTFASDRVTVRTHKMTDLSGITVTPGILPAQLRESLVAAVERIGAKIADTVRIDTTHFVTTEGRGIAWEKAVEMNIPVVRPEWVEGCERGGRIVGVRQYYLDADPRQRMANLGPAAPGPQSPPAEPSSAKGEAPLPALPNNNEQANGEASEASQANNEKGEDEDDKSEKDDSEDKKVEALDEQKVRVEDNDQHKVALRPVASPTDGGEPSVAANPVAKSPSLEVDADTEEGQKTPGAASFQDVAL